MDDIQNGGISLPTFIAVWNRLQGQTTPDIHFRMACWLEDAKYSGRDRLLLQAFRSCGKSTVIGLYAAWLLYRWPDLRILVLAAEMALARKMVRNVKRILERHPLTTGLKPEKLDQWGSDRFTIQRPKELRDPSMLARGIGANITGSRADVIICDDVEVPRTCETAAKRTDLRERLAETNYILVPGGTQLYIGTPHSWHTIYAKTPKSELGEDAAFLEEFERLTLPILDDEGQSAWPERFSLAEIARMKRSSGPNKFSSQMMLIPVNIAEGHLDPAGLKFYDEIPVLRDELKSLFLGDKRLVSATAWWDPAFGKQNGDSSVLAIIYADQDGHYYINRVEYLKLDPASEDDEATQQCRLVAQALKEGHVPSVSLEINGIGRFLPAILRRELARLRVPCAVKEISNRQPKAIRILEAFDAVMAAGVLYAHTDIRHTKFMTEMQEWRPDKVWSQDDGLDAVAGALSQQAVRIKPYSQNFSGRCDWMSSGQNFQAKTDFEV